jgi:hypothetical protein
VWPYQYDGTGVFVHSEVDDVVLELVINFKKLFFIYGKHKLMLINTVSAKSAVRIYLPETNPKDPAYVSREPMTLEGTFDNVQKYGSCCGSPCLCSPDSLTD